jgi:hypothetical protein
MNRQKRRPLAGPGDEGSSDSPGRLIQAFTNTHKGQYKEWQRGTTLCKGSLLPPLTLKPGNHWHLSISPTLLRTQAR